VVIAVARKTRSAEITSFGGLFQYAPGLTVIMTVFLASFVGIPPLGGWYAKFGVWRSLLESGSRWGYALAIIVGLNTVIAATYYLRVAKTMWFEPVPDGDVSPIQIPASLRTALAVTVIATFVFGVLPNLLSSAASLPVAVGH
jgi:NADH-quinone oxidoreductase subunit N